MRSIPQAVGACVSPPRIPRPAPGRCHARGSGIACLCLPQCARCMWCSGMCERADGERGWRIAAVLVLIVWLAQVCPAVPRSSHPSVTLCASLFILRPRGSSDDPRRSPKPKSLQAFQV
eukprot:7607863-Pyramimonas_sp.AAC.1